MISLDLLVYALTAVIVMIIVMAIVYRHLHSIELCLAIMFVLIGIFNLSIIPGGMVLRNYTFLLFFPFLLPYIIDYFRPEKLIVKSASSFRFDRILISIYLIFFILSVVVVNIKDLLTPGGIAKIGVFVGGVIFFCHYFPKANLKNPKIWKFLLKFTAIVGIVTGIVGIIFYFGGVNVNPSAIGASSSYFKHPNSCAFIYSISVPIILYPLLFERSEMRKDEFLLILISLFIVYFAMIITLSRAGYIAIFISTMILVFLKSKKAFIFSLAATFLIGYFFLQSFLLAKGSASSLSRLGLIYSAIEMLKSSNIGFLLGFGTISVFDKFTEFKFQLGPLLEDVAYPHNAILFYIMQFGILTLIPLLAYSILLIVKAIRIIRKDKEMNKDLIIPFTVTISLFFQSMLEDTVLFPEFYVFYLYMAFFGYLTYRVIGTHANNEEINSGNSYKGTIILGNQNSKGN